MQSHSRFSGGFNEEPERVFSDCSVIVFTLKIQRDVVIAISDLSGQKKEITHHGPHSTLLTCPVCVCDIIGVVQEDHTLSKK